jgi:hypothetical protein
MQICDFPGSRRIGKPQNWDEPLDGECHDIFVADHVDTLTGLPVMFTVYKLSDADIDALKNGGLLRLGIVGRQHPVFNMGVLSPAIAETVQAVPVGDMGGVIEG